MIGDSLTHQTRRDLHAALSHYQVRIAAVVGEGWVPGRFSDAAGVDILDDAAADMARSSPDVVVVEMGTNDAWNADRTLARATLQMHDLIERFGRTCIVDVEVDDRATAPGFDRGKAVALNAEMRRLAQEIVPPDPRLLQADGIHPRADRRSQWAANVASAVKRCLGRRPA